MTTRTYLVVGVLLLAVLALGVGGTVAAPADDYNETVVASAGYEQVVDERVVLSDWTYNTSTNEFVLVFEAEVPRSVTITEAVSTEEARSGQLHVRSVALDRGETTVRMPAEPGPSGQAGVSIVTKQGLDDGTGAFVSTAHVQRNPLEHTTSTGGWIGGAGLAIAVVVLAGCYTVRREGREPEVAT